MKLSNNSSILIAMLMVGASVTAYIAKPKIFLTDIYVRKHLSKEIPEEFKNWNTQRTEDTAIVDPIQLTVLKELYAETYSKKYLNDQGEMIMLSIAYGRDQNDGHDVHKPDLCYPAQGFVVLEEKKINLKLDVNRNISVKYMKTQKGERIEPLVYWTTAGNFIYDTKLQKKLIELNYAKNNLIPDGMIIRISTINSDSEKSINTIKSFIRDFYTGILKIDQDRYFGEIKN
ncbi:unnamed protein product, partial [Rotaria magnacalcarata]